MSARPVLVTLALSAATAAVLVLSLSIGRPNLDPVEVIRVLAGGGDPGIRPVVMRFRLHRALGGVGAGAALGMAGVLFQRLTRNPLATPDLIGVTAGATATAAGASLVLGLTDAPVRIASLLGGLTVAAAVHLLARRRGRTVGNRFVLVGVGFTYLLTSFTAYLVSQASLTDARRTITYLVGSLATVGPVDISMLRLVLIVITPILLLTARHIRILELDDDLATSLGMRTESTRLGLLACGAVLAAAAAATFGPVAFVALLAAQIGRGLAGDAALGLLPAAAVGALLVVGADLLARELFPRELPVGVLTAVLGAPVLVLVLLRSGTSEVTS